MIYLLSKLFTYTLLPPALFIWGLLLAPYFRKIAFILALVLYILSTQFGSHTLLLPLEEAKLPSMAKNPKIVVVLGGGYTRGELASSAGATKRILKALLVAKKYNLPLLYTGFEAKYAAKTIEALQKGFGLRVPVIYESESLNTYQNAKLTAKMIQFRHIYLVTSAYHMPRAYRLFRHFGFMPTPIKTDFRTNSSIDGWAFFPRMNNLSNSYLAIHEYLGLLSLWLRGITPNPKAP